MEPDTTGGGTVLIRASKSDQQGEGSTRYIGSATLGPCSATSKLPGILQGRCSARSAAAATPAPRRWAPTASAP